MEKYPCSLLSIMLPGDALSSIHLNTFFDFEIFAIHCTVVQPCLWMAFDFIEIDSPLL
jgi:hypothetical protein